jgi:UDP-glucose 4-epimerase
MNTNTEARKNVLVTGGTGYIGTHTVLVLIESGYDVTIVDNLVNSSEEGLKRVRELTGCDEARIRFFNVDLCDKESLERVFQNSPKFTACIHFAGLKAVGESVQKPLLYYENNLGGTFNLVNLLDQYGCRAIVFSSSATVSTAKN